MKILISKYLGFCSGVSHAYKMAIKLASKGEPVYMLGYLIHNQKVIDELASKGIKTIKDLKGLPKDAKGSLMISAHGVGPDVLDKASKSGLTIIDTTCPWVKKPQELAKQLTEQGYHIVIVGDKNHTEVVGIVGWTDGKAQVVETLKDVKKIKHHEKIAAIAQTTQSQKNFEEMVNELASHANELKVCNTICDTTGKMQRSAVDVAKRAEIMFIIGDPRSANTRRLKDLCEETGAKSYLVESADLLDLNLTKGFDIIGVTAGASTPDSVIEAVINKLKGV